MQQTIPPVSPSLPARLARVVGSPWFQHGITAVIVLNAIVIGLDTSETLRALYGDLFDQLNRFFLVVFIVEAAVKMAALAPQVQRYFQDGWNVFDFSIIVVSLIPATGELATLARLAKARLSGVKEGGTKRPPQQRNKK